jgi:hypothetical protein
MSDAEVVRRVFLELVCPQGILAGKELSYRRPTQRAR